jgi:PPM family protein phosphatase
VKTRQGFRGIGVIRPDQFIHASLTDVGIRRSHNQDSHACQLASDEDQWRQSGHVFLVADGMGAHAVGELASDLAVKTIPHTYIKHAPQGVVTALRKSFIEANLIIHNKGRQNREFEGMGTTTTALLLRPEGAWIGHVGDSRAYRVRNGTIEQLSFDHSLAWELARRQGVDPNSLQGIPSNVIVRSLGPEPLVQVDVEGPHSIQSGDTFVLCSDGLSGPLTDAEIGAIAGSLPPAEACRFLIDLANHRGGPDNITVLVIQVGGEPGQELTGAVPAARRSRLRGLPWPFPVLGLGVLLAGLGTLMALYFRDTLVWVAILCVMLALAALIIGSLGLVYHHSDQRNNRDADLDNAPSAPRIHRKTVCKIDRPLVEKLAKKVNDLKGQLESRGWEVNWMVFQRHREFADRFLKDGQLVESFREFCRSMLPLNEAIQRYRGKGEEFRPNWDRD